MAPAIADEVSLRLGGKEIELSPALSKRLAVLARETPRRCGPNTRQHPDNFGLAAIGVEERWKRLLEGSRLRVVFSELAPHLPGATGKPAPSSSATRKAAS